jgi:hypothetical protein
MGEWIEREPGYLSFEIYNCTYCGKMIPRHIWFEEIDGKRLPFCTPDHNKRYVKGREGKKGVSKKTSG